MTKLVNPQAETTTFVYDAAGQKVQVQLDNGTWTSFTYDAAGRTTRVFHRKAAGTVIGAQTYTYDKTPHRTRVIDNGDRVTWTYDKTYQLKTEHRTGGTAWRHTFTYDSGGNRRSKRDATGVTTYTYDKANRLVSAKLGVNLTTYTFDANGNETVVRTPSGSRTTYAWDYENQLKRSQLPDGSVTTWTWNADQFRVQADADGVVSRFLWDGENLLQEYDDADLPLADYTVQPQAKPEPFGNLVSQHRDAESSFYHFDGLGSTRALSNASEVVTDDSTFHAFGQTAASTGSTVNPFGWVGGGWPG